MVPIRLSGAECTKIMEHIRSEQQTTIYDYLYQMRKQYVVHRRLH